MTEPRGQAQRTIDVEAEQEVDFGRYWSALARRFWLPLAGLVVGALIGYALSLGGSQVFKATSSVYLGQPYTVGGSAQLQSAQTNPSSVRTIVHAVSVVDPIAAQCKMSKSALRGGVSVESVAGNIAKNGQTPLVSITVQASGPKKASCAANKLADAVVTDPSIAGFANRKIAILKRQIVADERTINAINTVIGKGSVDPTSQLVAQLQLRNAQSDFNDLSGLLAQAQQVEAPKVLTRAGATKVTARSRRNTVVVAALIGLIVGALAALMWDGVAAGLAGRRNARR